MMKNQKKWGEAGKRTLNIIDNSFILFFDIRRVFVENIWFFFFWFFQILSALLVVR